MSSESSKLEKIKSDSRYTVTMEEMADKLFGVDELDLKILRGRLFVENSMDRAISSQIDDWERIEEQNIHYSKKWNILRDLYDVPPWVNENIQKITELRNIIAHDLRWEDDIEKIEKKVGEMEKTSLGLVGLIREEKTDTEEKLGQEIEGAIMNTISEISELDREDKK